jgi:hypothetical protein
MTEEKLQLLMSSEEAEKYLDSFKEKMGYKDISAIVKAENVNNRERGKDGSGEEENNTQDLSSVRAKLIEGIQVGIIYFDEANKGITQKLLYPFEYNGIRVEELCFFRKLKLKDIKNLSQGKEVDILIKNISIMTNQKQEKIEELDTQDFDYTSSIYVFLQRR